MKTSQARVRVMHDSRGVTILPVDWDQLPAPGARAAMTPVAGGLVVITPDDPDGPMAAGLTDPQTAAWWLSGVFGEEVAMLALADPAAGDQAGTGTVEADVEWGELARPLRRFALGQWLHRWWPSASEGISRLDEGLLRAEIGTAAWEAEPCLPDLEIAQGLLGQGARALLAALPRLEELSGAELDRAEELAWTAVHAVLDEGDVEPGTWQELSALAVAHQQADAEVAALLAALDRPDGGQPTGHQHPTALVAGSGADGVETLGDVDWLQVNPRQVHSAEGNVLVDRFPEGDEDRLVVQVRAGDQPKSDGLRARVYLAGEVVPAVLIDLELVAEHYVGDAMVPSGREVRVDVFDPDHVEPPRFDASAKRDRVLVRRVVADRLRSPLVNAAGPFLCELLAADPGQQ